MLRTLARPSALVRLSGVSTRRFVSATPISKDQVVNDSTTAGATGHSGYQPPPKSTTSEHTPEKKPSANAPSANTPFSSSENTHPSGAGSAGAAPPPPKGQYRAATEEEKREIMSFIPAISTAGSILVGLGTAGIVAYYFFGPQHNNETASNSHSKSSK